MNQYIYQSYFLQIFVDDRIWYDGIMDGSIDRLIDVVQLLASTEIENLRDYDWLLDTVRYMGISLDNERNAGENIKYQVEEGCVGGIAQTPEQYVPAMLELSKHKIMSILEIGAWYGWNACFMTAYFGRLNPGLRAHAIDQTDRFQAVADNPVLRILPLTFHRYTTRQASRQELFTKGFDLCFIDAGHYYKEANDDWRTFGIPSKCVLFHDVNDRKISRATERKSCVELWRDIKEDVTITRKKLEFFAHPTGARYHGIGMLIDETA
jgi:hypothetical protein